MDTSEQYIEMCQQAKEIQKLLPNIEDGFYYLDDEVWSFGDYVLLENTNDLFRYSWGCVDNCYESDIDLNKIVWLPRQDQLFGMFEFNTNSHSDILRLSQNIISFIYNYEGHTLYSIEQFYLAFFMHEKYNKKWNGKEWIKLA